MTAPGMIMDDSIYASLPILTEFETMLFFTVPLMTVPSLTRQFTTLPVGAT